MTTGEYLNLMINYGATYEAVIKQLQDHIDDDDTDMDIIRQLADQYSLLPSDIIQDLYNY